jgi:hypothetical protein
MYDEIKAYETGETCSMQRENGKDEKYIQQFSRRTWRQETIWKT